MLGVLKCVTAAPPLKRGSTPGSELKPWGAGPGWGPRGSVRQLMELICDLATPVGGDDRWQGRREAPPSALALAVLVFQFPEVHSWG